jgi:O-antigen/teichoic acid export membrane protein
MGLVGAIAMVAIVVAAAAVGLIVLGVLAALVVVGLVVLAVDRLLLKISPKRRERRANLQRSFFIWGTGIRGGGGPVIDTTARLDDRDPQQKRQSPPNISNR